MKEGIIMERTSFEKLRIYQLSEKLADTVWEIVIKWDNFAKHTIGQQLVDSADSIGANIAEGAGRNTAPDKRKYAIIARGSLFEVKHWLRRAYRRNLLTKKEIPIIQQIIDELTPKLNAYIKSIEKRKLPTTHNKQPTIKGI